MHEFVHFTDDTKEQKGGSKQEIGEPISLCPTFVLFNLAKFFS